MYTCISKYCWVFFYYYDLIFFAKGLNSYNKNIQYLLFKHACTIKGGQEV